MSDKIHLTPREKEILHMLRTRAPSNKAIARSLNISESAVKVHVSHLLKKYKVQTRMQLVVFMSGEFAHV